MEFLKVEGEDGLIRDVSTKAILNTNNKDYEAYVARKNKVQSQKKEIERQAMQIEKINSELSDIKHMLSILINKQ
jgi:hypothetical protein